MNEYVERAMQQNGCELVTVIHFGARGYNAAMAVVIAKRKDLHHPYVVWKINLQVGGAYSGGYHESLQDAWQDYRDRVDREIARQGVEAA